MVQCSDGSGGVSSHPGTAGTTGTGGTGIAGTTGSAGTGARSGSGTAGTGRRRPGRPGRRALHPRARRGARGRLVRGDAGHDWHRWHDRHRGGTRGRDGHRRHDGRGRSGRQRDGGDGRCDGHRRNDGHRRGGGPQDRSLQDHRDGLDARVRARFDPDLLDDVAGPRQGDRPRTRQDNRPGGGHHLDGRSNRPPIPPNPPISPKSPPTISRTTNCSIPTTRPARFSPMRRAGLKRSRSSWTTGTTVARGRDSIPRPTSKTTTDGPGSRTTSNGGWFTDHDADQTPGTVIWQTD